MRLLFLIGIFFIPSILLALEVDKAASDFTWHASKITGKHFGQIYLKETDIKTRGPEFDSGTFVMDMSSFTVLDLSGEWQKKFLEHMKSEDFFDVKKFPTATLQIEKIQKGKVYGKLTLKNQERPISFPVTKKGNKYRGTMTFDRTKFGIVYGSGNFFKELGDKVIHDKVTVDFKVVLK